MLARAARRLAGACSQARLVQTNVESLPLPDAAFDTVTATCVFCSVADRLPAVPTTRSHPVITKELHMTYREPLHSDHGHPEGGHGGAHGGHSWMMIACCIPMLVIAVALVATRVASAGLLLAAVMCTVMMAAMMRGMSHGAGGGA